MKYRKAGRSGLSISEISLGTWFNFDSAQDTKHPIELIKAAYEFGINNFDCANIYGPTPHSAETLIGEALSPYPRDSYILSTKVFWPVADGPNQRGLSRKHITSEVDKSLRALKTDYIDIFYCHRYDKDTDLEETLRALDDLIRQGKVLYIGTSQWRSYKIMEGIQLQKRMNLNQFIVNQPIYNLLNRYIEKEIIPCCSDLGMGQIVYQGLAQGVLTGKYTPSQFAPAGSRAATEQGKEQMKSYLSPETLSKVEQINTIANKAGLTLAQLSLAWILRQPNISSVIIGASKFEQIVENCKSIDICLDDQTVKHIEQVIK